MSESLKKKFVSGTFWTTGQQVIFTIVGIIQLAVTSRLLTPVDFGTYAIALFFSSLGHVAFSMGFSAALIQKKEDIKPYLNTTWTARMIVSSITSLIIAVLIPVICKYYFHETSAILPSMVIMLSCIFQASSNPGLNLYMKEIQLKKIFFWNVSSKIISFFLVILFVCVFESYWGLIIAILSESIVKFISSFIIHPYRPSFYFSRKQFIELYSFSGWIQIKNITAWFASNLDTAIVGNALGSGKLGFYNRAQTVSAYPRMLISSVVDSVAYPIYATVSSNPQRIQNVFNHIQDAILLVVSLIALVFILCSEEIILFILGSQWTSMVMPFQILAIAYLLQTLFLSFIPVLRAFGYTKQEFLIYVLTIAILAILLYPLVNNWDLIGAGIAVSVCVSIIFPLMIYYVRKKTGISMKHYVINMLMSIISVAVVSYITRNIVVFLSLCHFQFLWIVEIVIACICYVLLLLFWWLVTKKGPGYLFIMLKNKL